MEIILKEDIIGLGFKNDIVTVKNGYGRNYLIPQGKAIVATPSARKVLAENLKQQSRKLAAIKASASEKAATLEGVSVVIKMRVSANGVTYGSVNAGMVAAELQKQGFDIDRKIVTMHDAKALGDFVATVHLHKEVLVEIPVKVIAEEEGASQAEAIESNEEAVPKAKRAKVAKQEAMPETQEEAQEAKEEPAIEEKQEDPIAEEEPKAEADEIETKQEATPETQEEATQEETKEEASSEE